MASSNGYMNNYMKERWRKRRAAAIEFLGGKCAECGSTEGLEFDHINPKTKLMSIARAASRSESFFWTEVAKCQLLCIYHHKIKTRKQKQVPHGGGKSGRKNCKCFLCKSRKAKYMREREERLSKESLTV